MSVSIGGGGDRCDVVVVVANHYLYSLVLTGHILVEGVTMTTCLYA